MLALRPLLLAPEGPRIRGPRLWTQIGSIIHGCLALLRQPLLRPAQRPCLARLCSTAIKPTAVEDGDGQRRPVRSVALGRKRRKKGTGRFSFLFCLLLFQGARRTAERCNSMWRSKCTVGANNVPSAYLHLAGMVLAPPPSAMLFL